jgi:chemotaxis protein histidine kinase CheA
MKKLLTILISCSLALAASATAQQEDASPTKKQGGEHRAAKEAHGAREVKPVKPVNEAMPVQKQQAVRKEHMEKKTPVETKAALKAQATPVAPAVTNVPAKNATLNANEHKKEHNNRKEAVIANKPATPTPATANASAAVAAAPAKGANQQRKLQAQAKKPDVQKVKQIKAEHASFKAQPKPDKVPAVTFQQDRHIEGAEHWQGERYGAFRDYHPERHDREFYHSHYRRVELIGGGYYYWNQGYWYPAWGYDTSAQYYAYDGPIYVGSNAEPPDHVIADVQASLQEQGYYEGEVDGLLGPLTRAALAAYQADNGLYTTEAIDEPTLDSLGMG